MVIYSFINHHPPLSGPGRPNPPSIRRTTIPSFSGGSAFSAQAIRRSDRRIAAAVDSPQWLASASSTDGTRIVSGSQDDTVRVQDAFNSKLVSGPFEGHSQVANPFAFRPSPTADRISSPNPPPPPPLPTRHARATKFRRRLSL